MTHTERLTTALGDRYQIARELGSGGMATVYLAKDLKHDREVALKVLRPELGAVLGTDRFLAEIKITARLDHPHILTLIDSGAADGFLYYVLPYVRGESLRVKLEREKQLGIEEALGITRQIASALDYAHQHGVVHRDIKPENILLHEGEAVLADFGIALAVKEAGGNRLTETGLSLGTPQYMSPEQATGDRTLDARSDVYSLAAVLYEMLAGEPPVTGATAQAMIAKLMTERPSRIRIVRDTVPEGIDHAVAKALAKVPADRFASAGAFAASLVMRTSSSAQTPKRPKWLVPAVVAGTAAVAAAVAASLAGGRGGVARTVAMERVQITFNGNARNPSLSPDGQRVAYTTRVCDASGGCLTSLVIQDVAGAGQATVMRGASAIWDVDWSADGRYLLVSASYGPTNWGVFAIPTLGGVEPRFLGCCGGSLIAGGDTAIMVGIPVNDSLGYARVVTLADGVAHDSFPVPLIPGADYFSAGSMDHERVITLTGSDAGGLLVRTADRAGRATDSLFVASAGNAAEVRIPLDGRSVIVFNRLAGAPEEAHVLRYAIDVAGRIAQRADTIARRLRLGLNAKIDRQGMLVYDDGPIEYDLWSFTRTPGSNRLQQGHQYAVATARMSGSISNAGDRILVSRTVGAGARQQRRQFSLVPFGGGPETPLGPVIEGVEDWDWLADDRGVAVAVRDGETMVLKVIDAATGQMRDRGRLPAGEFQYVEGVPGAGLAVISPTGRLLRLFRDNGTDTLLNIPASAGYVRFLDASADGTALASVGWSTDFDSLLVHRIDVTTGVATRLAAIGGEGSDGIRWLSNGTIEVGIAETAGTIAWYRIPERGGRAVRIGTPGRDETSWRLSKDGRRVLGRGTHRKADVFIVRNFGDLLNR